MKTEEVIVLEGVFVASKRLPILLKIPYDTVLFRVFIAVLYDASYLARGNSTTMSSCYHVFSAQLQKKK